MTKPIKLPDSKLLPVHVPGQWHEFFRHASKATNLTMGKIVRLVLLDFFAGLSFDEAIGKIKKLSRDKGSQT